MVRSLAASLYLFVAFESILSAESCEVQEYLHLNLRYLGVRRDTLFEARDVMEKVNLDT